MKSKATTVPAYFDSLPPDRRAALQAVRRVIVESLDRQASGAQPVYEECMQYGVVGYCVPHRIWPPGHHTRPELPLMYLGLSSQKNDMVVYMLCLFQNEPLRAWFEQAWQATGKKLFLEVSGAGCCLRFKKLEDLSLDVIAETLRRLPIPEFLEHRVNFLARLGKGPDGQPLKHGDARKTAAGRTTKRKSAAPGAKSTQKNKAANRSLSNARRSPKR